MNADRPTIAHVLHRLSRAGAEVLAADLSRRLDDRYRFVFFCLDEVGPLGDQLRGEGFDVVDLGRRPGVDLRVAGRLRRATREHGVGLLHAHQYTPFFYAAVSRGLGARPPVLFTEHGRHYPDLRKLRRVWANKLLFKPTDHATAVGRFVKRALVDHEGLPADRVDVIHNGIDPDQFNPDPVQRAAARAQLGLDNDLLAVFHVARFHPVKDHATSIHAFALAHDQHPNARLVLIGDGDDRSAMERFAWDQGVAEHCLFLGVRDDVDRLLPAADVFILSSLSEGVSVTLLEAMAAQVPIVATEVGGNGEIIEHGRNGLLSPRQDPHALAANLITLLDNPDMRRRAGEAGRKRLLKHFTQQRMHDAYARLYAKMG